MSALIERTGTGDRVPRRSLLADGALPAGLAVFVMPGTYFAPQNQW
jgi:hypothetical protein